VGDIVTDPRRNNLTYKETELPNSVHYTSKYEALYAGNQVGAQFRRNAWKSSQILFPL
jgi:hypothetical protein